MSTGFIVVKKISKNLGGKGLGKVKIFKNIYDYAFSHLQPEFIEIDSQKMYLDPRDRSISRELILNGIYEKFETELIKEKIKPGMIVMDLGANVGYYTLIISKIVGNTGKVYAFEPDPTNYSLLEKNIKTNNIKNVILVNKAVSNKVSKEKLFLSDDNLGGHHLRQYGDYNKFIEVETIVLDDFLKGQKIDFIKMDIEGAEAAAIQGMKNTIKSNKNIQLITEFSYERINGFGMNPKTYLEYLIEVFFVFYINEKDQKLVKIQKADIEEMATGKKVYPNLFCVKKIQ